jgi:hypothetical protein
VNKQRIDHFLEKVHQALWVVKGKRIAILGLAFKANTGPLLFSVNDSTDRADGVVCQTEFSVSKSALLNELSTNTGRRRVVSFSSPDRKSASLYLLPLVTTYD